MPDKRYGVILADPPWEFRNRGVNGAAEKHYPVMKPEQIKMLPILRYAEQNCVLVLWAVNSQLDVALDVMKAWSFNFVTSFPWIKFTGKPTVDVYGNIIDGRLSWGTGFWARGCSETILVGRKGHPRPPQEGFLGILSDRLKHSKKPDSIYEYCESMYGPYLELFARGEKREGWDVWGNEVESDVDFSASRADTQDELIFRKGVEIKEAWETKQGANWIIGDCVAELIEKTDMNVLQASEFASSHMIGSKSHKFAEHAYRIAKTFPPEQRNPGKSWFTYRMEFQAINEVKRKMKLSKEAKARNERIVDEVFGFKEKGDKRGE